MAHQHFPIIALLVETPLPLSWHSLLKTTIWRGFLSSPIHPSQARITFLKCHFEWHLFPIVIDRPIESLFYFIILRIGLKKKSSKVHNSLENKVQISLLHIESPLWFDTDYSCKCPIAATEELVPPSPTHLQALTAAHRAPVLLRGPPSTPIFFTAAYLPAISWSKTRTVTSPPKRCPWPSWFTAVKLF